MSFYLALHTGIDYTPEDYHEAAGTLLNLLSSILSDREAIKVLTHNSVLTHTKSDIEVSLEEGELVAKAVVDMQGDPKVKLDKAKFTKMAKGHRDADRWPAMKIVKKAVAPDTCWTPQ